MIYLQSRNRDTGIENKCKNAKREGRGGGGMNGGGEGLGVDIYTVLMLYLE